MVFKGVEVIRAKWGYTAPGEPDAWIAEAYPDELTCYDLNAVIKKWLRANGVSDKSVCEVLEERAYVDLGEKKPAVGRAASFLSHTQKEDPFDMYTCMGNLEGGRRDLKPGQPIWVDACSLRQCASNEFRADEVVQLIKEIGYTYVSMDFEGAYPSRSFCLLETYAAVVARQPLAIRETEESDLRKNLDEQGVELGRLMADLRRQDTEAATVGKSLRELAETQENDVSKRISKM